MFKFLKSKIKLPVIFASLSIMLLGAMIATVAWFAVTMQIIPDVDSGIIMSYFESGDGSEADPYVIARPIQYYNLVRLTEVGYDGFNGNSTYFQFGDDLDSSGVAKFYNYNDSGVQQSGYSTTLNMNYYSGTKALSPLGSANHPFLGHINGNNLTVSKLHISGEGRADVGVFGYVGTGARVSDLYFDTVDIDLHKENVSEINGSGHTSHSTFTTFGYIAGHIYDKNTFDNVYINNSAVRNSDTAGLPAAVKNNFGYIGYCDTVTLPNVGDQAYRHTLHAEDVYQYLNSNYSSISGSSLVTRNTEYSASGSFGESITNPSSGRYSFTYQNSKAMSLATAGYQHQEKTYIAQYKNGNNYQMMTGATVTQTAPANQTTAGTYVYYDSTNSKWVYYTARSDGSSQQSVTYNVYYLSYQGCTAGTSSTTYYLKYNNGSLGYTTTAPTSYASTPDYYFAFATAIGGAGVTSIEDGTSSSYYIYSPHNDVYLYAPTNQETSGNSRSSLAFGDDTTIAGSSCEQAMFGISGSSSTEISIDYGGTPCKILGYNYQGGYNDPLFGETNGQKPALVFTLHGDAQTSGESDPIISYSFVKTSSSYAPAANDIITFVNETYSRALGEVQNGNNRSSAAITISSDAFVPGSSVARIKLVAGTGDYAGKFALQDVTPDGSQNGKYLYSGTGSQNRLYSGTLSNAGQYYFTITYNSAENNQSRGKIKYNNTNSIFSCYSSGEQAINIYKLESSSITIHHEGAIEITEQGESQEQIIVDPPYDIYYYDESIGTSSRAQLTSTFVTGWSLSGNTTYVTIAPEIITGWNLVEDQMDLIVGEKYVIASNTTNYTAGPINLTNGYLSAISSTFNAGRTAITSLGANTYQFTLNGNSSDGYTFSCDDGQLFANNDTLNFTDDGIGRWNITISAGVATIQVHGNTTYKLMFNSDRFKTYSSNQTAVRLYRLDSTEPQYIGDKIGNGYNPNYIDVVGSADFYSTYFRINGTTTRTVTEGTDLNQTFFNTKYVKNGVVLRIPNRGSLDYGTVTIACGANLPVFVKSGSTNVTLASVDCDELDAQNRHLLYLNKYNIYQLSYCTLNSSGQINGSYDSSGDEVFQSGDISEFVLVLGAPSSTNVDISYIDITFSTITGNLGDFGKVGFRSAPGTVPGEIFSFTYDIAASKYVYSSVAYDSANNRYNLYFKSSVALTLYVYNYDANRAQVYVNGTRYYGPYNAISISASASPGSGGWTSY